MSHVCYRKKKKKKKKNMGNGAYSWAKMTSSYSIQRYTGNACGEPKKSKIYPPFSTWCKEYVMVKESGSEKGFLTRSGYLYLCPPKVGTNVSIPRPKKLKWLRVHLVTDGRAAETVRTRRNTGAYVSFLRQQTNSP